MAVYQAIMWCWQCDSNHAAIGQEVAVAATKAGSQQYWYYTDQ